jgi:hypothetical protein
MAAGRTLTVSLVANTNSFRRGMMSAVRDAQGFNGKMTALGANLRGVLGPALIAAGAAAAAFAVKLGVDAVKAAAAEEQALVRLQQALANAGDAMAMGNVETYIAGMQRMTGIADGELRPAMITLVNATQDATDAQNLLGLALDVSAGSGRELRTVTEAMAKASLGQTTALRRLGVPLSEAAVKSKDMNVITRELAQTFRGQAEAAGKTFQGRMNAVSAALGDLQESLGKGLIDGMAGASDGANSMVDALESLQPVAEGVGNWVGRQIDGFADLAKILELVIPSITDTETAYGQFINGVMDSPVWMTHLEAISGIADRLEQLGVISQNTAERHEDYRDAVVRTSDAAKGAVTNVDELGNVTTESADAAADAAEKFDLFAAAINKTQTVVAFRQAIDEVSKAFKRANTPVNIFNEKGKENFDLLNDLIVDTAKFAEGQTTLAGKTSAASQGLNTLGDAMVNAKMDSATRALLLEPFQALINDLDEAGVDVAGLQQKLDSLRNKTITVTVNTQTYGRPPGVSSSEWHGSTGGRVPGFSMGTHLSDSIPAMLSRGEYVVRASSVQKLGLGFMDAVNMGRVPSGTGTGSGVTIGTLNVTSAPGERAEDSVPRSLRRLAFVAGLNV